MVKRGTLAVKYLYALLYFPILFQDLATDMLTWLYSVWIDANAIRVV
jgi:hypothetical protein